MGLRASLDMAAKRKKSFHCPYWESSPSRPAHRLVTILTEFFRGYRKTSKDGYTVK